MTSSSEDSLESLLRDVAQLDWAQLRGAYGPTDGIDHYRDAPRMFTVLATADDVDSMEWGQAYDDALLAHVWHQYRLYPVTPIVTELLLRLVSLRMSAAPEVAEQLALALRLIAESVPHSRDSTEASTRAIAADTARAFARQQDHLRDWLHTPLEHHADAISTFLAR